MSEIKCRDKVDYAPLNQFEIDELYLNARAHYQSGKYSEAVQLFTALVQSSPFEAELWKGLGASYQMHQDYEGALRAWGIAAILNSEDPLPHFHAAECMLSQGSEAEALKALSMAYARTEDEDLKNKIEMLQVTYGTN